MIRSPLVVADADGCGRRPVRRTCPPALFARPPFPTIRHASARRPGSRCLPFYKERQKSLAEHPPKMRGRFWSIARGISDKALLSRPHAVAGPDRAAAFRAIAAKRPPGLTARRSFLVGAKRVFPPTPATTRGPASRFPRPAWRPPGNPQPCPGTAPHGARR